MSTASWRACVKVPRLGSAARLLSSPAMQTRSIARFALIGLALAASAGPEEAMSITRLHRPA